MMIHEITAKVGKHKARKRVGRGRASGQGKTAGRGHKGARSRAGFSERVGYEGGQMPYFRRIPKRGFTNSAFRTNYHVVNVSDLDKRFENGADVNAETLIASGLIRDASRPVKVLGNGDLSKKLNVTAAKFSSSAREKIEGKGGSITEVVKKKWTRPKRTTTAKSSS